MKTIFYLTMLMASTYSFSQEWKEKEPSTLFAVDENDDTANVKVGIGTANPSVPLEVKGQIVADSAHFNRYIKLGNSIVLGGFTQPGNNELFSDNGDLLINNNAAFSFNTILHSNNTGSDINGIAEIIKIKTGTYNATVSLDGYQPQTTKITIVRGKVTGIEIALKKI